jgi:hypothetical protein
VPVEDNGIMNAIIPEREIRTWLSSSAPATLVLSADETVGWKSEAQRLALGARRRAHACEVPREMFRECAGKHQDAMHSMVTHVGVLTRSIGRLAGALEQRFTGR